MITPRAPAAVEDDRARVAAVVPGSRSYDRENPAKGHRRNDVFAHARGMASMVLEPELQTGGRLTPALILLI
jgi:hypothetical protein